VNRRAFLGRTGLVAGGALIGGGALGAGAATAAEEGRLDKRSPASGMAVGAHRPPNVAATTITYRVPTNEPVVALTLDDGPSTKYTQRVLDILERKNVQATFNLIGKHAQALPDLARRVAERHEIGNHTWSHPNMSFAPAPAAARQLRRGAKAITEATGHVPATYRPPYGYFSGATIMVATGMGYPIIMWDFEFNQHTESASENIARMTRLVRPGSIILGHDGGTLNCEVVVAALPELIDRIHDKGLRFVTTSEILAVQPARTGPRDPSDPTAPPTAI
jgi:peptidoglycan/xylan/chitin deacetylase (PgdA/CDA1 family)